MNTRPVFESFSSFVDFLHGDDISGEEVNEKASPSIYYKSGEIQVVLGKISTFLTSFGDNWKTFESEWKRDAENSRQDKLVMERTPGWSLINGALEIDFLSEETKLVAALADASRALPDNEGITTTVKSYDLLNARGSNAYIGGTLGPVRPILSTLNAWNFGKLLAHVMTTSQKKSEWDFKQCMAVADADNDTFPTAKKELRDEKLFWPPKPYYKNYIMYSGPGGIKVLTSSGDGISIANIFDKEFKCLCGGVTTEDAKVSIARIKEEIFYKKVVFYTVKSIEIGGGTSYTDLKTTTVEVPTKKEGLTSSEITFDYPTPDGLFKAMQAVPVEGKEAVITTALNQLLSQYTSIESIIVQGSASWEWKGEDGSIGRNDAKNIALAKDRAEYFVKTINGKSETPVAKLAGIPGIVQTKEKEKEPKENHRKVILTIKGTKDTTYSIDSVTKVTTEGAVTSNYDKMVINEYTVTIPWKSPGIIKK
jgi:hypothetical protein